jgi:hypothetical protein
MDDIQSDFYYLYEDILSPYLNLASIDRQVITQLRFHTFSVPTRTPEIPLRVYYRFQHNLKIYFIWKRAKSRIEIVDKLHKYFLNNSNERVRHWALLMMSYLVQVENLDIENYCNPHWRSVLSHGEANQILLAQVEDPWTKLPYRWNHPSI